MSTKKKWAMGIVALVAVLVALWAVIGNSQSPYRGAFPEMRKQQFVNDVERRLTALEKRGSGVILNVERGIVQQVGYRLRPNMDEDTVYWTIPFSAGFTYGTSVDFFGTTTPGDPITVDSIRWQQYKNYVIVKKKYSEGFVVSMLGVGY